MSLMSQGDTRCAVRQPSSLSSWWGTGPAVEAPGIARPARIYDLRPTFASNTLGAGVTLFELARIMGSTLDAVDAAMEQAAEADG